MTDEELESFKSDVEAESDSDLLDLQSDSESVVDPDHQFDAESDGTTSTDSGDAFAQASRDIVERNPDETPEFDTASSVDIVDYPMSRFSEFKGYFMIFQTGFARLFGEPSFRVTCF